MSFFSFYLSVFHVFSLSFPLVALRDCFGKMCLNLSDVANGRGKMDNIRRSVHFFSRRKEVSIPIVLVNAKAFPGARYSRRVAIDTNPLPDSVIFDAYYRQYM